MGEVETIRLGQAARGLNVSSNTIVDYLLSKGVVIVNSPNTKLLIEQYDILLKQFSKDIVDKQEINDSNTKKQLTKNYNSAVSSSTDSKKIKVRKVENVVKQEISIPILSNVTLVDKIDLDAKKRIVDSGVIRKKPFKREVINVKKIFTPKPRLFTETERIDKIFKKQPKPAEKITLEESSLKIDNQVHGLKIVGKIEMPSQISTVTPLPEKKNNVAELEIPKEHKKTETKSVVVATVNKSDKYKPKFSVKQKENVKIKENDDVYKKEINDKIKTTLARLESKTSTSDSSKNRYKKRKEIADFKSSTQEQFLKEDKILRVTEYVSANDLASLLNVGVNEVISTCMSIGILVSINQRLDAELITIIADEFAHKVEFIDVRVKDEASYSDDRQEDLQKKDPIVTVMGHVDHGKTSLLDYIHNINVAKGETGGITQHIGAYEVVTESGQRIVFLDTPGHEAFTAMRARGVKITDIVIIVIAADDSVMPQTREALNHAQAANVPIIIAINKIDKPQANSNKVKDELSAIGILTEDWGGKYQCQEISAKTGQGISELLEKILVEADMLALKANPNREARGTVIEATLDQGRGYVATTIIQSGTLVVGDLVIAGMYYGRVKAMTNHKGDKIKKAIPATPVRILGLNGAPQAGDILEVVSSEKKARETTTYRQQILREQGIRTKKHITLDEIGRRLAIGNFKELKIIVKGDVDGSIEALSDSLLRLSTPSIQVRIVHKGVGAISESDVLLASATDAIIIGFQVRPSANARQIAEKESIDIRLYSIIYDAINNVKDAMQGMLAPTMQEVITGNAIVREIFKIHKVGTIAGSYMTSGYIKKINQVRVIRDGIVMHTGSISQLKRFKDDVKEVKNGFEFGISIDNFNDIAINDTMEGFEQQEVQNKLSQK